MHKNKMLHAGVGKFRKYISRKRLRHVAHCGDWKLVVPTLPVLQAYMNI